MLVLPLLAGAVCGFVLSESEAGWWVANLIAALGGVAGGYEHAGARSGAARGAIAGLSFGAGVFIADAVSAAPPVAEVPSPMAIFPLIAALAGTGLGALGGRLRGREEAPTGAPGGG